MGSKESRPEDLSQSPPSLRRGSGGPVGTGGQGARLGKELGQGPHAGRPPPRLKVVRRRYPEPFAARPRQASQRATEEQGRPHLGRGGHAQGRRPSGGEE